MTSSIAPSPRQGADVALIYPPYEKPVCRHGLHYTSIPLGVAYLGAVLEEKGLSVSAYDCNIDEPEPAELANTISDTNPCVVGVTVTSPGLRYAHQLIAALRDAASDAKVAVGGPHITADPASARLLGADACFTGESEYRFAEYCEGLLSGSPQPGLTSSSTTPSPAPAVIEDLDLLPHPARHLFQQEKYGFTSVSASRGCPFKCSYCAIAESPHRKRSPESVRDELASIGSRNRVDFTDDVFTLDRAFARALADVLGELGIGWNCTTRCDLVDSSLLAYLAERGLQSISFGVESGSQDIRRAAGKNIPDSRIRAAFKASRDAGVKCRAYAMVGLPGEDKNSVGKTFSFVESLEPDEAFFSPVICYPGTRIWADSVKSGVLPEDAWVKYMRGETDIPYLTPEGMGVEEVFALIHEGSKRFYLTPKRILSGARDAKSFDELVEAAKAGFSYFADALFFKRR